MTDRDFKNLWQVVIAQFSLGIHSIHGPKHWKQVEKNGLMLAEETGADATIIKLFALFHDSRRQNDSWDEGHGLRGAELATIMRGVHFDLPDNSFTILLEACAHHTNGQRSSDIIIATCWDADRLDLPRAGITPDAELMGTGYGKRLARLLRPNHV